MPESTFATMLPRVIIIVPASVLKTELFSTRFEARVRDPDRDLNNEFRSRRPEAELSELVNDLMKVLVSEATRLSELENDLKSDVFLARLEDSPNEPTRFTLRVLAKELARPRPPVRL